MTRVPGRNELERVARDLHISAEQVERTLGLLEEGNTIPFITRYRRDWTGGLEEETIRAVERRIAQLRALEERKQSILKSIESQGQLTPGLKSAIRRARHAKRLEDLYRPFKPKKQSLAMAARQRGLEPFVNELLDPSTTPASSSESQPAAAETHTQVPEAPTPEAPTPEAPTPEAPTPEASTPEASTPEASTPEASTPEASTPEASTPEASTPEASTPEAPTPEAQTPEASQGGEFESLSAKARRFLNPENGLTTEAEVLEGAAHLLAERFHERAELREHLRRALQQTGRLACSRVAREGEGESESSESTTAAPKSGSRKGRKAKIEAAFRQYFDYAEPLQRIKAHRVLAINRGERERVLRVRVDADLDHLFSAARPHAVSENHPYEEFLLKTLRDAIARRILPSLEREFRRELTERAEEHAIEVFACNLRKLLLQPPVRNKKILAIAPAFKSGCKLAVLDPYGKVLATALIHVVGSDEKKAAGRTRLVEVIRQHKVTAVAIGNGSACRETEVLVADVFANELADSDIAYTIVNEAGASVYSTSELGREELPDHDPIERSAISIGRRLLDPLSELVKISPAHLGVGMYQHDVKQKHLQETLDTVVESCVNFVGVDVNTASPALLRYVSGLNQLTARRIYEHRLQHGPFRRRSEFPQVAGFGDAAYVQAAGFLKISDGAHPLDATRIHPETYETVARLIEQLEGDARELLAAGPEGATPTADEQPGSRAPEAEASGEPATGSDPQPEAPEPEAPSPKAPAPEATEPEATAPETPARETSAPESPEPGTPASEVPEPEVPAPEATGQESESPSPTAAVENAPEQQASETPASDEAAPTDNPASVEAASAGSQASVETPPEAPTEAVAEPTAAEAAESESAPSSAASARDRQAVIARFVREGVAERDRGALAEQLGVGQLLLDDLIQWLVQPQRDPREDLPAPVFRRGILKLEDLEVGMELTATVLNVVDFGAFVDIGLPDSGLVHISRLADRYIRDPHDVVSVGDVLRVWVYEIDKGRRRVSLSAIDPSQPKRERGERRRRGRGKGRGAPASTDAPPQSGSQPAGDAATQDKPRSGAKRSGEGRRGKPARSQASPSGHQRSGQQRSGRAKSGYPKSGHQKKRPPRAAERKPPPPPLTEAMQEGREPLRSFSDLMQFYSKKPETPADTKKGKAKKGKAGKDGAEKDGAEKDGAEKDEAAGSPPAAKTPSEEASQADAPPSPDDSSQASPPSAEAPESDSSKPSSAGESPQSDSEN